MNTLIIFASKYGQTRKVAARIASVLAAARHEVQVVDIETINHEFSIARFDVIMFGSPIYASKHSTNLGEFIKNHRDALNEKKTAFFSVSLSAAGREDQRDDAIQCLDQFLADVDWIPTAKTIFAGGVPYRDDNWFMRWIRKHIVRSGESETETTGKHEYSNWASVDAFARDFIALPSAVARRDLERTSSTE